jgi:hypothetical protein
MAKIRALFARYHQMNASKIMEIAETLLATIMAPEAMFFRRVPDERLRSYNGMQAPASMSDFGSIGRRKNGPRVESWKVLLETRCDTILRVPANIRGVHGIGSRMRTW